MRENEVSYSILLGEKERHRLDVIAQMEHKTKSKLIREFINKTYEQLAEHLLEL